MNFKDFSDFIVLLKTRVPGDANVIIDFSNKRWINSDLIQDVCSFDFDNLSNLFKIQFFEAKDKKKELLYKQVFNINTVRR